MSRTFLFRRMQSRSINSWLIRCASSTKVGRLPLDIGGDQRGEADALIPDRERQFVAHIALRIPLNPPGDVRARRRPACNSGTVEAVALL
jgi:hypothetical protein